MMKIILNSIFNPLSFSKKKVAKKKGLVIRNSATINALSKNLFFIHCKKFCILICSEYIFVAFFLTALLTADNSLGNYSPLQQELELKDQYKEILLRYTRLLINEEHTKLRNLTFPPQLLKIINPVIITLFDKEGNLLISQRIDGENINIVGKISKAIKEIKNKLARKDIDYTKLYIHIMVISYTWKFANFGIKFLFDYKVYEPRVTGLVYELGNRRVEINPLECLAWDFNSKKTRTYLARKLGISPKEMPKYSDLKIEIYRVIHFAESFPDKKLISLHRGHKLFTSKDINNETILKSLKLIGMWFSNNVVNSEITYEYNPTTGRDNNTNRTIVRSTIAVWILNKLAYFLNDNNLKKLGKICLEYYLEHYFNIKQSLQQGKLLPSNTPIGRGEIVAERYSSAGFLVASILERGEEKQYEKEVKLLMDWAMSFQKDNGILWTKYAQSQGFDPGQLLLTTTFLYERTREKKYKEFLDKSFDAYLRCIGGMMQLGTKIHLSFAPGWFTQAFTRMYLITKDEKYPKIVYAIAERILKWYRVNKLYSNYFDNGGILAPYPGFYGNVSVTTASLEALVDACYVAKLSKNTNLYKECRDVIKRTVAYLIRLQYLPENTYYVKDKKRVIGGFKYDLVSNKIWMDNIWHLTNAFIKIINYKLL